ENRGGDTPVPNSTVRKGMPKARVIGVDPGPTPGICLLREDGEPLVLQCNHEAAVDVVRSLMDIDGTSPVPRILAVEKFVVCRRAARSAPAKAGEITRNLIGELQAQIGRAAGRG